MLAVGDVHISRFARAREREHGDRMDGGSAGRGERRSAAVYVGADESERSRWKYCGLPGNEKNAFFSVLVTSTLPPLKNILNFFEACGDTNNCPIPGA